MLDPAGLFRLERPDPEPAATLVVALDGFVDAGHAGQLTREHLLATCPHEPVATFDVDQLHDYRARRPPMLFDRDHWASYDAPQLVVHRLSDAAGTPFLLLAGPEPDVQWERFVAAMLVLVERLGVRLTVALNAIPMAVPHTRPVGVTAHGSRPELIAGHEPWVGRVQVPGAAAHLLELRLAEQGRDAVGFAVHVPHYLAQVQYPAAAEVLVSSVAGAGGLSLPTDALRTAAVSTRTEVDEQVAGSTEVAEVVRALETQYDAFVAERGRGLLAGTGDLPSADELGAELERFLAEQHRRGEEG